MNITYKILGMKPLARGLKKLFFSLQNFKPLWEDMKKDFYSIELNQFLSQGRGGWKALSPKYAAWKAARYPGRPILVLRGDLKRSLISQSHADSIYKPTRSQMEIGTSKDYASYHQTGTSKMPARPPIDFTGRDKHRLIKRMQEWIVKNMRGLKSK